MGFLKRLRGGGTPPEPIDPAIWALLEARGLAAFDRQLAFGEVAGQRDWSLDQEAALLRLGEDLELPAQLIGSAAHRQRTWLWAWANPSVDEAMTIRSRELRAIGEARGIDALSTPEVPLGRVGDGHTLMLAVVGLLDADAYFRCPYAGGEAFVTVAAPQVREVAVGSPGVRAVTVVSMALTGALLPVTRASVEAYLRWLGLEIEVTEAGIQGVGGSPSFDFDELGRVTSIRAREVPSGAG